MNTATLNRAAAAEPPATIRMPEMPVPAADDDLSLATDEVRHQFMKAMTPRNFDDVWRMSDLIAQSDLAPKDYKGKPGNVMIAWQTGVELGITSPLQAIQNIAVINGRPTIWGDMMLAICRASPAWSEADFDEWIEGEGMAAVAYCSVRRRPSGNRHVAEFSMQNAKDAGLVGKQGPWQQYPKRMLQMRARSFALRDTFTPELKGIRMAEEERDITQEATATSESPPAADQPKRAGTAGRVGGTLARRREQARQQHKAREIYDATAQVQGEPDASQADAGADAETESIGPGGEITCAYVCEQINQATTRDEMALAIDLARHVPESDQGVVNEAYKARLAALKKAAAKG